MSTQTKYTMVNEVVRDYLSEDGKYTPHQYLRLLRIAHRGLKELTFDVLGDTKVTLMEVSSSLRADLPSDYIDYNFIGVVKSGKGIEPLGFKRNIPLTGTDNANIEDESYVGSEPMYGLGGGQNDNGYYRPEIDYDNWQIVVSSIAAGSYIYLEYISDGRAEGGNCIVHPYAEEALLSYIAWKDIKRKKSVSANEKEMARRDYYNEKRLAVARMSSFTKEEALQQTRKGFKQTAKL